MGWAGMAQSVRGCMESFTGANVALELRRAARKFCRQTGALTEELAAIDLVAGQTDYTLSVGTGYELRRVRKAVLQDRTLGSWEYELVRSTGKLRLAAEPASAEDDALVVTCTVAPLLTIAADLPGWFEQTWGDAIEAGALARLLAMRKKPWADPEGAAEARDEWAAGIGAAMRDVEAAGRDGNIYDKVPNMGVWP